MRNFPVGCLSTRSRGARSRSHWALPSSNARIVFHFSARSGRWGPPFVMSETYIVSDHQRSGSNSPGKTPMSFMGASPALPLPGQLQTFHIEVLMMPEASICCCPNLRRLLPSRFGGTCNSVTSCENAEYYDLMRVDRYIASPARFTQCFAPALAPARSSELVWYPDPRSDSPALESTNRESVPSSPMAAMDVRDRSPNPPARAIFNPCRKRCTSLVGTAGLPGSLRLAGTPGSPRRSRTHDHIPVITSSGNVGRYLRLIAILRTSIVIAPIVTPRSHTSKTARWRPPAGW